MHELAALIKAQLPELENVFWIKNAIDNDLKEVSVVFNLVVTNTINTFDKWFRVNVITADVYLNVPEKNFMDLANLSIYIREQLLELPTVSDKVRSIQYTEETLEKLEDTNTYSNRITFQIHFTD